MIDEIRYITSDELESLEDWQVAGQLEAFLTLTNNIARNAIISEDEKVYRKCLLHIEELYIKQGYVLKEEMMKRAVKCIPQ